VNKQKRENTRPRRGEIIAEAKTKVNADTPPFQRRQKREVTGDNKTGEGNTETSKKIPKAPF